MNIAKLVQDAVKQMQHDVGTEVRYRNSYSGRGMYGAQCAGIVGSQRECMQVIAEVIKEASAQQEDPDNVMAFDNLVDTLLQYQWDSMGRSDVIIYWEDVKPLEGDDLSSEEDDEDR